jgi:hypothetical protein
MTLALVSLTVGTVGLVTLAAVVAEYRLTKG